MRTKLLQYNKHKHNKCKWVTFGIIKSRQFRDNLYKKTLKMTNTIFVEFGRFQNNLNTYNKILKNSIQLAKRIAFDLLKEWH